MGVNMSMREFFRRLSRLTGVPLPPLRMPGPLNVLGAQLLERWAEWRGREAALAPQEVEIGEHFFYFHSSKAERELGFRARDPHETLYDTVQYLFSKTPAGSLPGVRGELAKKRKST
jgi:dihydroflavonol-4-reductase